jgi:hypothetical protein
MIMLTVPAPMFAKGETVKITITGTGLATPIEITGPKIRDFSVWSDAGASVSYGDSVNGNEETET